nr:VQ motif-containing protein 22 [Ipomoea batatas]
MMITSTKSSTSSINGVCGVNAAAVLISTSPSSSGSELSPRNGGVRKPVRRRSRASKKTPTTHLNADAASFRAVVQQFTGCHTAATFSGAHKGPINLNFGVQEDDDVVFDAVFEMRYGGNESGFRGDRCRKERSSDAALTLDDLDLDNIPFHDFIEDFSLMSEDWNDSSLF